MQRPEGMQKLALAALVATSALVIIAGAVWGMRLFAMSRQSGSNSVDEPSELSPWRFSNGGTPRA